MSKVKKTKSKKIISVIIGLILLIVSIVIFELFRVTSYGSFGGGIGERASDSLYIDANRSPVLSLFKSKKQYSMDANISDDFGISASNSRVSEQVLVSQDFKQKNSMVKAISQNVIHSEMERLDSIDVVNVKQDKDAKFEENKVMLVSEEPISTFSTDTDDASYKIFKQHIGNGSFISKDLIRVEEFINAFEYDYKAPTDLTAPFASHIEIVDSNWSNNKIIKIGVKGYEVNIEDLKPINLTFLVDVSGSMSRSIPKVQTALKMLVNKLRPEDTISIVTYAGWTGVALDSTEVKHKNVIFNAIDRLNSGGGTNGEAGIHLAYAENQKHFVENGINRILLVSDGDFNVGIRSKADLEKLIEEKRATGTTFSTIGMAHGSYNDSSMEALANKGNGRYTFISDMNDARQTFSDKFLSTLVDIAKDVKFQIEFNKDAVKEYRLIGYENRVLNKEDFNNDKIDAGEIPSGMAATALYEITLAGEEGLYPESRYEAKNTVSNEFANELAFLKVRYKKPNEDKSKLLQFPITRDLLDQENISKDTQFALLVAEFAQKFKGSKYIVNERSYDEIINDLLKLDVKDLEKARFIESVQNAAVLFDNKINKNLNENINF